MRYPLLSKLETRPPHGAWWFPDLPGCFSAGDTLEEALIQAEDAISGWIEAAIDDGQDIPHHRILKPCAPPIPNLRVGCWGTGEDWPGHAG